MIGTGEARGNRVRVNVPPTIGVQIETAEQLRIEGDDEPKIVPTLADRMKPTGKRTQNAGGTERRSYPAAHQGSAASSL